MPHIGQYNKLKVIRQNNQGYFLNGEELGELLLPAREVHSEVEGGEEITVFFIPWPQWEIDSYNPETFGNSGNFCLS
ncbi:S1 RNA-binding domain-containing protein [bacterium]